MRKAICLVLAVLMLATAVVACDTKKMGPLTIDSITETVSEGDSIQIRVTEAGRIPVEANRLFWSVDDTSVASITSEGVLTVKKAGYFNVVVKDREDLSNIATMPVFCAYQTIPEVEMTMTDADGAMSSTGETEYLVSTAVGVGKTVVRSMTGKIGTLGVVTMMLSFFDKDKYMFSFAETKHRVDDGVVYTVSDWGNQGKSFNMDDVTGAAIYSELDYAMKTTYEQGATFDAVATRIRSEIATQTPNDGIFHMDKMDSAYEYRIVIRADYTTFTMEDFYSNGAITGLGLTIRELWEWTLEDVADVNDNYQYSILTNDIVDVTDIRLCIEYRPVEQETQP